MGIYDDIVNIVSCGNFPNSITQADIENGRSDARNRVIANVFKELGLIEQWGSGIARIKSACLEAGLKEPKIEEINDFVDVEFYRPDNQTVVKSLETTEYDQERLNSAELMPNSAELMPNGNEVKIILFLEQHQKITSLDVAKLLNLKERRSRDILKELENKGVIQKIGKTKGSYYVLRGE